MDLNNKRAKLNGYSDYGDQWRQKYDSTTFEETVIELYSEMEPLYKQLHAYVRRKLFEVYGEEVTNFLFCFFFKSQRVSQNVNVSNNNIEQD